MECTWVCRYLPVKVQSHVYVHVHICDYRRSIHYAYVSLTYYHTIDKSFRHHIKGNVENKMWGPTQAGGEQNVCSSVHREIVWVPDWQGSIYDRNKVIGSIPSPSPSMLYPPSPHCVSPGFHTWTTHATFVFFGPCFKMFECSRQLSKLPPALGACGS